MKEKDPQVGIIMGSDSDLPVMLEAAKVLEEFGVGYEIKVASAHRTPEYTAKFVRSAAGRGIKVIIAGAGGAAHLPGVAASMFAMPVIGVPIKTKSLDGMDSLLSIVQMPGGVPVATVGINNAKNAGLLAVQILAAGDGALLKKMEKYKKKMEDDVIQKNKNLKI
jgi:phosphoribosylaminoimidazole carboxylase PurE protein